MESRTDRGFIAIEKVRDVEELIRQTVSAAKSTANEDPSATPKILAVGDASAPAAEEGATAEYSLGQLGSYRLLRELGAGGMGTVYEAEDVHLRRRVALKALKPELARDPLARQRFLEEARAAAALQHDHVVAIFHVGDDRGVPYLIMPLLVGQTLSQRLQQHGPMPMVHILILARQLAEGLTAAHAAGLIHRDIKPSNVLLETLISEPANEIRDSAEGSTTQTAVAATPNFRVKILDFGLARRVDTSAQLTKTGVVVGTPSFMAPEQARGLPVDRRSDLFSLGAVLYLVCTGELPFRGPDAMSVLLAVTTETPRPARLTNPSVPVALSDLIDRLLAKDPANRPDSAADVSTALRAIELDR